jgi:hypothetical protein
MSTKTSRAIGIALLTIATIGTLKIAIDMWRLGLYPGQTPGAEVQAPPPPSPPCQPEGNHK